MVDLTPPIIKENVPNFVDRALNEWNIPAIHRQHLEDDLSDIAQIAIKTERESSAKLNGAKKKRHNDALKKITSALNYYKPENFKKYNANNPFGFDKFLNIKSYGDDEIEFMDEYYWMADDNDMNIIEEIESLQKKLKQAIDQKVPNGRPPNQVRRFTTDRLLRIYQYFNNFKSMTNPEKTHSEKVLDPVTKFIDDFMCQFIPGSVEQNITDHAKAEYVATRARELMKTTHKKQPI